MISVSKTLKQFILSILFLSLFIDLPAQNFDSIVNSMQNQFNKFKDNNQKMFDNFVKKNDEDFANFLKNAWKQYALIAGVNPDDSPKPKDKPVVDKQTINQHKVEEIPVVNDKTVFVSKPIAVSPTKELDEPDAFPTNNVEFDFYGAPVKIKYDKNFITKLSGNIDEESMANYFTKMSSTKHYHFIDQLMSYKTNFNLNDWGYYKLLYATATKMTSDKNSANLLIWFCLIKSRYKVKIGYNQNNIYLLLPTAQTLYGLPYYTFDNQRYFALEKNIGSIFTYDGNYPDAILIIDMSMPNPLNLGQTTKERKLSFNYHDSAYSFTIKYNLDNMKFYDEVPLCDIKVMFDAPLPPIAKESVLQNLKPLVKGRSQLDATNLLLTFVQTAFEYKTDPEQFGRQKYNFAEETLYYPFCDCEDRAVLFTYLVKELVGLECIGLGYPGHMSSAVHFDEEVDGDNLMYKNKKYIISDATYINAPVGMCMPQYLGVAAKVVSLDNVQNKTIIQNKMWSIANKAGGHKGDNTKNIVFDGDGNAYLTGFFNGTATFGPTTLKANGTSKNAFVAKIDPTGNPLWAKQFAGDGDDYGRNITLDENNNCYITGIFGKTLIVGNEKLQKVADIGVFTAKLDKAGNIKWVNQSDIDTFSRKNDYVLVTKFDNKGDHLASLLQEANENFDNYGISFDNTGNCIITANLYASARVASMSNVRYDASAKFNLTKIWKDEMDRLVSDNTEKTIAGIFAFFKTMNMSGSVISGRQIQDALDSNNPNFKKAAPNIYKSIGNILSLENSGGVITVNTKGGADVEFANLILKDKAKLQINTFKGGNAQVQILSGANLGQAVIKFDLNFVKLLKTSGDLLFDYDKDSSQKTVNLKKDILQ